MILFGFIKQRLLVEKINQQLSEQIQLNLVQPTTATQTTSNSDVIKQIQVKNLKKIKTKYSFVRSFSFSLESTC